MTMTMTQPIKRHGGKYYLADWILSHRPEHYITYCEPYFGGGSVLLRHDPKDHSEVVNDLDEELITFWGTLANPFHFGEFLRLCAMTPFSEQMFQFSSETPDGEEAFSIPVRRAHQFFIRSRQSRQGLCKDFATMSKSRTRRGMNEQVSQWLGAVEGLAEVHERMKRVVILHDDALRVIQRLDHVDTWFYLDPPYPHSTRTDTKSYGEHECSDHHHFDLLALLTDDNFQGKFTLSGYHSREYDDIATTCGWRCEEKQIDNKASSAAVKPTMTECLWMNY